MTNCTWHIPEERDKLSRKQIAELFLAQQGLCPLCSQKLQTKGHVPIAFTDEHLTPLSMGGTNELSNRALVCNPCAAEKTADEATVRAKAIRVRDKHIGAKKAKRPMAGSRASKWKRKIDGTVERR